ncbi:indole-3-glycerol phosphate synthase TrpC [Oscillospiraceae bacterium MB08-C2-2]|nr:indole-3-glycerol phosphate synthase TrpC [Oscillospiraceae bacterium MB08-C2-2]
MILEKIAAATKLRVNQAKKKRPLEVVREQALALPAASLPFEQALGRPGISFICEVKKASPSKGLIAREFPYVQIAKDYEAAGAAAVSVLTEPFFFQGSDRYLTEISRNISLPILRKDFTVDEYQLYEAKLIGADAILLICALLDTDTLRQYLAICRTLGLSALVEAHTPEEIESALEAGASIIGVNNRNLKTFQVDLSISQELRTLVPSEILFVAESGVHTAQDVAALSTAQVDAILLGEALMRSHDKAAKLADLREGIAV